MVAQHLLALAGDPATPVEEARTAALQAARLVHRYKFVVAVRIDAVEEPTEVTPSASRRARAPRRTETILSDAAGDVVSSLVRDLLRPRAR